MTDREWLVCKDPMPMMKFLRKRISKRKLRLFAVACSQRIWSLMGPKGQKAVEVSERYADGESTDEDLSRANEAAREVAWGAGWEVRWEVASEAALAARATADDIAWDAACAATKSAAWSLGLMSDLRLRRAAFEAERSIQADLLRDIFTVWSVEIPPSILSWQDGTIPKLAQAIYDESAFGRLPILADALEDAGCTDEKIMGHCRGTGPHVRGCWVVDLLVKRQ